MKTIRLQFLCHIVYNIHTLTQTHTHTILQSYKYTHPHTTPINNDQVYINIWLTVGTTITFYFSKLITSTEKAIEAIGTLKIKEIHRL